MTYNTGSQDTCLDPEKQSFEERLSQKQPQMDGLEWFGLFRWMCFLRGENAEEPEEEEGKHYCKNE